MHGQVDLPHVARNVLFYLCLAVAPLVGVSCNQEHDVRTKRLDSPGNFDSPPVVLEYDTKKGEQLISALITTNEEPERVDGYKYDLLLFPEAFDWVEYARVKAAIKELEVHVEEVWPSIVEHMMDDEYSFSLEAYNNRCNYSRGFVCYTLAQSWLNRGFIGHMPFDSEGAVFDVPIRGREELQKWCQARRNKKLYEIQIEAAELAIAQIRTKSRYPQEMQNEAIVAIQTNIAKLREARKPIRGSFFVIDVYCPLTEDDAARFRDLIMRKRRLPIERN